MAFLRRNSVHDSLNRLKKRVKEELVVIDRLLLSDFGFVDALLLLFLWLWLVIGLENIEMLHFLRVLSEIWSRQNDIFNFFLFLLLLMI